jgi:hypothetical protein
VGATPNVAVPRQIRDTLTPVVPRTEYFISNVSCSRGGEDGRAGGEAGARGIARRPSV